ncbi:unnamed protein product [Rhizophagus irregularis]|uniref:Uncharacterized protein n=1 Tax=Rhizophagus irregularis TaxID=588596 RepID=A0A916EEC1_9GLOM|nr:unnamed protein product [Rhizophagus irregularis]
MGLLRNTWNSTHSQYPTWIHTEFCGLMLKIPCVLSQDALYGVKDHMSEVLEIFASDTLPSSPCSTYIRMPIPPPKLVKIPIVQSSCATSN